MNNFSKKILGAHKEFNRLRDMISNNTLPHAMLFTGIEGIGKKEIAVKLSRIILCFNNGADDCDCPSCHAFAEKNHPDFFTLYPTSKGKSSPMIRIDEIGELLTNLSRLPLISKTRVAIIDDADLMNEAASNRLLKTLEEPAGDIKFFLIAKRRGKILPTILSRTMPVAFSALSSSDIITLLKERGIEENVAKDAANLSFGSMKRALELVENDGLKIINEVLDFVTNNITYKSVLTMSEKYGNMEKIEVSEFFAALMLILRDALFCYEGLDKLSGGSYGKSLIKIYGKRQIFEFLKLAQEYEKRIQSNVNLRLFMEGFLLRYKKITASSKNCLETQN